MRVGRRFERFCLLCDHFPPERRADALPLKVRVNVDANVLVGRMQSVRGEVRVADDLTCYLLNKTGGAACAVVGDCAVVTVPDCLHEGSQGGLVGGGGGANGHGKSVGEGLGENIGGMAYCRRKEPGPTPSFNSSRTSGVEHARRTARNLRLWSEWAFANSRYTRKLGNRYGCLARLCPGTD